MALKDHYEERYGSWAGNPAGQKPDFTRCCESVMPNGEWRSRQCSKSNGHGPDGAYCKTHDPEERKRRDAVSAYNFHKKNYEHRIRYLYQADQVIRAIAEGHNDPRALCQEWLDKMGDKLVAPTPPEATGQLPPPPPGVKK
jgi:hypothetical protein